jgi:hypothetical protein
LGHRGRPRKANARRRQTTKAGRSPPPDFGTSQLRKHKLVLAGSVIAEADCLSVLYGRKLIDEAAFRARRRYAFLTALARRGWGLQEGSVNDLWRRLIAGNF